MGIPAVSKWKGRKKNSKREELRALLPAARALLGAPGKISNPVNCKPLFASRCLPIPFLPDRSGMIEFPACGRQPPAVM